MTKSLASLAALPSLTDEVPMDVGDMDVGDNDQGAREDVRAEFLVTIERCERDLSAFLRRMVRDVEQARDLLQDTLYDAWRALRRGAPPFVPESSPSEVRRWLFHAAYCRAASSLRRRRLIAWEPLDNACEWSLPASVALVSFEDRIAEQDALDAALARLTPDDAACLLLTIVHGFTAAEAGAILNASAQAVAKRTSRAKRRLLDIYLTQNAHHEKGVAK